MRKEHYTAFRMALLRRRIGSPAGPRRGAARRAVPLLPGQHLPGELNLPPARHPCAIGHLVVAEERGRLHAHDLRDLAED